MTDARARGLTLVELLVALALVLVVSTLLFASFHAMRRTLERVGRDSPDEAAGRLLDRFAGRLAGALTEGIQGRAFQVSTESDDASSRLLLHGRWTPETWPPPTNAPAGPCRLEYWVDPEGGRGLLESVQPLRGPGAGDPPVTNVFAAAVTRFTVRAWAGEDWTSDWPPAGQDADFPAVLRLRVEGRNREGAFAREADVPFPAGWVIRSRLERQGSSAGR